MTGYVIGYDAIRTNIPSLPKGAQVYAGYATGSGGVPWTEADFTAHATALGPCLRIDQDPAASNATADYLDVESGAATIADAPGWAKRALEAHAAATRPGQRPPAIYMSASNVTPVVNALIAGGVHSGVGLIIANWSITEAQAVSEVLAASGPFPVAGIQFSDPGLFDVNVYGKAWLASMSGHWEPAAPVPAPPAKAATVPSGPREWTTAGMDSLAALAAAHGTAVSTILRLTAERSPAGLFEANTATYLDDVFSGKVSPAHPVPAGLKLWLPD